MALQCEEDPIYEYIYKIQNNSSYDLIFITEEEEVKVIRWGVKKYWLYLAFKIKIINNALKNKSLE